MFDLKKLKYTLMPGNIAGHSYLIDQYNLVFGFWKGIWSETLHKLNLPALEIAQFLRHNYVSAITYEDKVVACHLYTKYDIRLEATKESEYFKQFSSELITHCQRKNINTILTQEYLSVAPDFRKSVSGISGPELVTGLGIHVMFHTNSDSTAGTVRAGAPSVERVGNEMQCELLDTVVERYNLPHKFFIAEKSKVQLPGNEETKTLVKRLWNERTDYTELNQNNKIAAA